MTRIFTYQITSDLQPETTVLDFLRSKGYSHRILARLKRSKIGIRIQHQEGPGTESPGFSPVTTSADFCTGCDHSELTHTVSRTEEKFHTDFPGAVRVRVSEKLRPGDVLIITLAEKQAGPHPLQPVDLPLDIVFEDTDILVIDKPSGMPVHPSMGNHDNTLANALAFHCCGPSGQFTCRIINRLDKDTSGLLIAAKNALAAAVLCEDMKARKIRRTYLAIVHHVFPDDKAEGTIDAPIARVPGSTIERCVDFQCGERAVTHYRVIRQFQDRDFALVQIQLETGRTHQIRVHMKYIGHPLLGDYIYAPQTAGQDPITRQALHSFKLSFTHPVTGNAMNFTQPLPDDMKKILKTGGSGCPVLPHGDQKMLE